MTANEIHTCLQAHNKLRALHLNTPDLIWDEHLANIAQTYAEYLAASNSGLVHDQSNEENGWGENLYLKISPQTGEPGTCAEASLSWYACLFLVQFS